MAQLVKLEPGDVLVLANIAATVMRFVLLRGWVFRTDLARSTS